MKLKNILRLEKEIYFVKYVFTHPIGLLWECWKEMWKPKNLLFIEFLVLLIVGYRSLFFYVFENFKVVYDKLTLFIIFMIALTFIYYVYSSQVYQVDYRKKKEEKLKDAFDNRT